jgi:hypothetical protein
MNRKLWLAFFGGIGSIALWVVFHEKNPPANFSQPAPSFSTSTSTTPRRVIPQSLPSSSVYPTPAITTAPASARLEGNRVEFRVENGLAIAFGDTLLGRLEEGNSIDSGISEMAPPKLWERPEIPYAIQPNLPHPERVEKAIQYLNQNSPVTFVPHSDQADALVFEVGKDHCLSYLGKMGGLQPILLADGCQPQEILHEILHALGFIHEHSRTDRDRYVEILSQNIEEKYRSQFNIVPDSAMEAVRGTPFDYHSIMIYSPTAFSASEKKDQPTLRSKTTEQVSPVSEGLSTGDLQRLRTIYRR